MRTISARCAWLWPQLRCPVYATPFAAAVLRRKLAEVQLLNQVKLHVVPPGGAIDLRAVRVAVHPRGAFHSRGAGTGDRYAVRHGAAHRRLEARPAAADRPAAPTRRRWQRSASAGVLAMICDSTNAMVEGHSGSESRGAAKPVGADPRPARPHRGDLLRLQHRAHRESVGARGARGRPQRGAGRPLAAQPRRRGARVRLSEGPSRRS